ncbi:MAG TPA: EpsG family protein [Soehngenia sp.]|nr:EpsG family protein [Soehngenia sp.]
MTSKNLTISSNSFIFIFVGFVLILIAGFRPIGIDGDSLNYVSVLHISLSEANFIDKEPAFWIINELNKILFGGNEQTFFLIFAILGVSLKLIAIRKYSLLPILSIFTYVSMYFVLHEMTQIRAGVATAIFLFALEDIKNRNFKGYFLKTILAMLFHYSAIIMLLVYFINPNKLNTKLFLTLPILGIILGILLAIFKDISLSIFSNITSVLPQFIGSKIELYILLLYDGKFSDINIFNFLYLSLIFIYYFSLLNYRKMKSQYDIIFIKISGIMLFSFYFFTFLPVLAFRVSEFFGVIFIFLIPHVLLTIKQKSIASIPFIIWLMIYFIFIMVMQNLHF